MKADETGTFTDDQKPTVMRKKIVAGNWKMNLQPAEAAALVREVSLSYADPEYDGVVLLVCPPALYLPLALNDWQPEHKLLIGAQNCHAEKSGAFTGEVSAEMLAAIGVSYCIVGHSERRTIFGESDEVVQQKTAAILRSGMKAIVCCGETLDERENNQQEEVVGRQLKVALNGLSKQKMQQITIAYEPVWAIGTGKTASSDQAQEMHHFIREQLSKLFSEGMADETSILYGGSCKPGNARELFDQPDVDGGLIGGASLDAEDFLAIARSFN